MTEITFGSKGEEAGANKGDEVVVNEPIIETDGDRMTVTVTPEQAEAVRKMLAEKKEAATEEPKPEWQGDFKSPEELRKAYDELRAKMSEGPAPTAEEKAAAEKAEAEVKEAAGEKGVDLDKYVEEFAVNKALTADSYAELEAAGMARDVVDNYIAGRLANQSAETNALYASVGGEEQYAALIEWGLAGNVPEEARQAYDRLLSEENYAAAGLVLRGFVEQYKAAEGSPPGGINPGGANPSHGVKPFATKTEMIEAINSKPYKNGDRAFVAEVEARMHVSKF
jgi:hypothetical protein